jgi:hypothetical protein
MRDESRQILPAGLQNVSARIILDANGTFVVSEIPGLLYGDRGKPQLDTGSGVWTLVSREGGQQIQFNFQAITAGSREGVVPYGTQLHVSKRWSTVTLSYYLGDPDQGRRVEFEKK